jgi:DNA-directed RNA polymerase specialized sigma24 family protein
VEAADVAQDVVTAYLRLGQEPDNRKAWTRAATKHRLIDVSRRQLRVVDLEVELAFRTRHRNGPSAGVISGLQGRQVLGVLSAKQRALLTDHLSGWSAAEIAEAYGYATAATATQTISRVLKKVRDSFAEMAYDLEPQRPY